MEEPETLMSAETLQLIILPAGVIAILFAVYLAATSSAIGQLAAPSLRITYCCCSRC